MKLLYALVGVAALVLANAAPAQNDDPRVSDHLKNLLEFARISAIERLDRLKQTKDDLLSKLDQASELTKETIRRKIDDVSKDMIETFHQWRESMHEIFQKDSNSLDAASNYGVSTYAMPTNIIALLYQNVDLINERLNFVINEIKTATGERKRQLQQEVVALRYEIRELMKDIFAAAREIAGATEEADRVIEVEEDNTAMGGMMKSLRQALNKKLDQLKDLSNKVRSGGAAVREEARRSMQVLQEEISRIREEIYAKAKEVLATNA